MSWYLHGSGRRYRGDWGTLLDLGDSWTASWADHLGFHEESLPVEAPKTTHLWAWAPHRWLRVRIDSGQWWAALLVEGEPCTRPVWAEMEEIEVPDITRFRNWGDARNVKQYRWAAGAKDVLQRDDMIQLVPLRPTSAIFVGDTRSYGASVAQ